MIVFLGWQGVRKVEDWVVLWFCCYRSIWVCFRGVRSKVWAEV